MTFTYKA